MKRAFVYSIVFVVVFVVWKFLSKEVIEVFSYLWKIAQDNGSIITYSSFFVSIQAVIVFILVYGWIKKSYPGHSTFFRGIIIGLLISLLSNSFYGVPFFPFFLDDSVVELALFLFTAFSLLNCFITGQAIAFSYDQLVDRFLKPDISGNTVGTNGQDKAQRSVKNL